MMRTSISSLGILWLAGCGVCGNTVKQEIKSPDGKYVATAFVRNCGATTDYSAQVDLRKAGRKLSTIGNVYRGNASPDIEIAWLSSTHLVITSGCMEVRHHTTNFDGITIQGFRR